LRGQDPPRALRLLLIGQVRLNREGLAALLNRDGRLCVTALASTQDVIPDRHEAVDVVVVDAVEAPIVALGAPADERQVIALAELGVVGFLERDASLDELVASVVSAAHGEATLPPRIATTLLRRVTGLAARRNSPDAAPLTVRELQVVDLIAEGLSNKEIATKLCIEVATVKNHVHNILEKLQVSRRSDAVAHLRVIEADDSGPAVFPVAAVRSTTRSRAG
jgi:DNA-binding NarL/FixJ family response regulator